MKQLLTRCAASPAVQGGTMIAFFLLLAAIWRWTPLGEGLDALKLAQLANGLRSHPLAPLLALTSFVVASLTAFPITLLIIVAALIFGPTLGFIYALLGSTAGAGLTYGIGDRLGSSTVRRLSGSRLNRLSQKLAERGILAVALVRIVPLAPFTVINLVAGASHIRFRDFMLGTVLGMAPNMLALTIFADSFWQAVRDPRPATVAWVSATLGVLGATAFALRQWLNKTEKTRLTADRKC
jgi:phospholipase D1/2